LSSEERVSRREFQEFSDMVADKVCGLEGKVDRLIAASGEPKEVELRVYRCGEEGCSYQTADLGAFVEHVVDERLRERSAASPEEETFGYGEQPKRRHTRAEDFLECPECAPRFEKMLAEMGWEKPEPKREGGLRL